MDEQTKKCAKCESIKPISDFRKSKTGKFGVTSNCKICINAYERERRLNGDESHKIRNKNYYSNNSDKVKTNQSIYRITHKDDKKEYDKEYREKNSEIIKVKKKEYMRNNKDIRSNYFKRDYRNRPYIYMWRHILYDSLIRIGGVKEGHTIDLLEYSALQLKEHLESLFTEGMSWDNYGEWHVDHKKPISLFSPDTPPNIVNALSNLQPLWAKDNLKKHNKF